jgi:hypothetical protein
MVFASLIAMPLAARATVYTISVPAQLTGVAAPAGTVFNVGCFLFQSYPPSMPQDNLDSTGIYSGTHGWANLPPLNSSGSTSGNVTISITQPATAPALKSYICGFGVNATGSQTPLILPNAPSGGLIEQTVSGKLP